MERSCVGWEVKQSGAVWGSWLKVRGERAGDGTELSEGHYEDKGVGVREGEGYSHCT